MSHRYPRALRKRYQASQTMRREQAKRVADRLLGKKFISIEEELPFDIAKALFRTNFYVTQPRHNVILTGFTS